VSCVYLLCLITIADIICMESHLGSKLCVFFAWLWLLTLLAWNPIQAVNCTHLLCLILIADIACMKSHLVCELCVASLLDFDCWHCLHEILSRMWVVCIFSAQFTLLTSFAWNLIQEVSCVSPLLDCDHWHTALYWLVCSYSIALSALQTLNIPGFLRQIIFTILFALNSM